MKLAVSTYSLSRWRKEQNKTFEDTIDWIADSGVEAIEFTGFSEMPSMPPVQRAAELRNRAEKRGLKVVSYCCGAELLSPPDKQRETIEATKRQVDIAQALGAKTMRHDVTRGLADNIKGMTPPPKTFDQVLKVVVPAIR